MVGYSVKSMSNFYDVDISKGQNMCSNLLTGMFKYIILVYNHSFNI